MEDKSRRGESLKDHAPNAFLDTVPTTRGLTVLTRNAAEIRNTGVETVDSWQVRPR